MKAKHTLVFSLLCLFAAMLLCTEDTLSRPMPHVYQVDPESNQATPIVVPEAIQQENTAAVGNGIGSLHDVRVKELRIIAQQQVLQQCCVADGSCFWPCSMMPHTQQYSRITLFFTSQTHMLLFLLICWPSFM